MSNELALRGLRANLAKGQVILANLRARHTKLKAVIEDRSKELDQVAAAEIRVNTEIDELLAAIKALELTVGPTPGPQEARGA